MTNSIANALRVIRSIVALAIAALGVLAGTYPSWTWVPAVISFLGVFATHAIPALTEVSFLPAKAYTPTAVKMDLNKAYGKGYTPTVPQDVYPYSTDPTTEDEPPKHA